MRVRVRVFRDRREHAVPSHRALPEQECQFLLKEFEVLRSAIESELGELRRMDRWVVVSVGAFWAWFLANPPERPGVVLWAPLLVIFFFGLKDFAMSMTIGLRARYLREKLEPEFRRNGCDCGYESFLEDQKARTRFFFRGAVIKWWAASFYSLLICVHLAFALLGAEFIGRDGDPDASTVERPSGPVPDAGTGAESGTSGRTTPADTL